MTYGEVATAREAIGSGLQYHGMPQVSYLYKSCIATFQGFI